MFKVLLLWLFRYLNYNKHSIIKDKAGFGASGTVFRVFAMSGLASKEVAGALLGISSILWIRTLFLMPFKNLKKGKSNVLKEMTIIATRDQPQQAEYSKVKAFYCFF